jgi:mycothiol synthase
MEAAEITVVAAPDQTLIGELTVLLERVVEVTGHPAVGEQKRVALLHAAGAARPGEPAWPHAHDTADGFLRLLGVVIVRDATSGRLAGCAPVVSETHAPRYAVELAVDPATDDPGGLSDLLLAAAVDLAKRMGGEQLRLWIQGATETDQARATLQGFELERDLIQMRCTLPLPAESYKSGGRPGIETRAFRPGVDEEAWLAVNNRAFETHPEQGNWDLATLVEREHELWFDPNGLLMLEVDGQLAGSCWTKIHADTEPPMGEIYVIGVDPQFHGRGWGRGLTEAGLDWLARQGLTTGMLYVDAANVAAVSMYRSMGFVNDHVDRSYIKRFSPGSN